MDRFLQYCIFCESMQNKILNYMLIILQIPKGPHPAPLVPPRLTPRLAPLDASLHSSPSGSPIWTGSYVSLCESDPPKHMLIMLQIPILHGSKCSLRSTWHSIPHSPTPSMALLDAPLHSSLHGSRFPNPSTAPSTQLALRLALALAPPHPPWLL